MNGNLAQVIGCKQNSGRLHEWDVKRNSRTEKSPVDSSRSKCGAQVCQSKHRTQLDRLRFVLGGKYAGYYGYNANGERVYKLTGTSVMDQVNSGSTKAQAIFDEAVLYPNPYMVVTRKGYTKHYYAGTERLATVIGGGGLNELTQAIVPAVVPPSCRWLFLSFFIFRFTHVPLKSTIAFINGCVYLFYNDILCSFYRTLLI